MTKGTNTDNYKESIKATSIFGGVQLFNIVIKIVRSKFIAVLLGPNGMGIFGLLNSTILLVSSFTNFGLQTSAVRNIADANGTKNSKQIPLVIYGFAKISLVYRFIRNYYLSIWG